MLAQPRVLLVGIVICSIGVLTMVFSRQIANLKYVVVDVSNIPHSVAIGGIITFASAAVLSIYVWAIWEEVYLATNGVVTYVPVVKVLSLHPLAAFLYMTAFMGLIPLVYKYFGETGVGIVWGTLGSILEAFQFVFVVIARAKSKAEANGEVVEQLVTQQEFFYLAVVVVCILIIGWMSGKLFT